MRDKYLRELGELTSRFNALEVVMKGVVNDLLNISDYKKGLIVSSSLSFNGILNLAKDLLTYSVKDEKALKLFKEIFKNCIDINIERNKFVHSMHLKPDDTTDTIFRVNIKYKNAQPLVDNVGIDTLIKLNQEIYDCLDKIGAFRDYYNDNKLYEENKKENDDANRRKRI